MRSRYSAYSLGLLDHVFRTWHPRTRPDSVDPVPGLTWIGLEVLEVVDGGPGDETGVVEFRALFDEGRGERAMRERSRFERRVGRWVYVDGVVD
jgi:SEC-C motif-containing protein